jgi:hypothetical protein
MHASTFYPPLHAFVTASIVGVSTSLRREPAYKFLLESYKKSNHFYLSTMPRLGQQHLTAITFGLYDLLHLPNHQIDAIQIKAFEY